MLDTLIVRSVLVTALNLDVGRHMWWPSGLAAKRETEAAPSHAAVSHKGSRAVMRRTQTD